MSLSSLRERALSTPIVRKEYIKINRPKLDLKVKIGRYNQKRNKQPFRQSRGHYVLFKADITTYIIEDIQKCLEGDPQHQPVEEVRKDFWSWKHNTRYNTRETNRLSNLEDNLYYWRIYGRG
jgi:hypothetical protein